MKMNTFYKKLLLFIFVISINQMAVAQNKFSKTIEKTLAMSVNNEFQIENKYGDIEITGWDKNSIEIIANIQVFDKKDDQALDLLNRIQSEIKIIGDVILVKSEIVDKNPNAMSSFFNRINPIVLDKSNVQINYTIHLPKNVKTDLNNRFGDVMVNNYFGYFTANVEHGNITLNNDINEAKIEVKYGNLKVKSVAKANFDIKNGDIDLKSSKNLIINSSGATIQIDQVSQLNLTSNRDKIHIKNIENVSGDYKFSTIAIDNLNQQINATLKVTNLIINKVSNSNAVVALEQESSDITIDVSGLNYDFKAYLREGTLRIPKTFKNINNKVIDKNQKIRDIKAVYGNPTSGKFTFKGYKGSISLKDASLKL